MKGIFSSLRNTVLLGFVFALCLFALYYYQQFDSMDFTLFFMRWLHVLFGIMWIGLLWYFNFVQIPNMGKIPDEQKPAISKFIAPTALFWFRWAALLTVLTGLLLAHLSGYLMDSLLLGGYGGFGVPKNMFIGIGMWLGIVMFFNVWVFIWPNQKKVLGIVEASAEEKVKAVKIAFLFSRLNTALSIPMLFSMVAAQNLY